MDKLSDLELTRLCAMAMGLETWTDHEGRVFHVSTRYDPLTNDAQKWQLAERFPKCLIETVGTMRAKQALHQPYDLGRILVTCVARLHRAKSGG